MSERVIRPLHHATLSLPFFFKFQVHCKFIKYLMKCKEVFNLFRLFFQEFAMIENNIVSEEFFQAVSTGSVISLKQIVAENEPELAAEILIHSTAKERHRSFWPSKNSISRWSNSWWKTYKLILVNWATWSGKDWRCLRYLLQSSMTAVATKTSSNT